MSVWLFIIAAAGMVATLLGLGVLSVVLRARRAHWQKWGQ
jgi:hypothetical protein